MGDTPYLGSFPSAPLPLNFRKSVETPFNAIFVPERIPQGLGFARNPFPPGKMAFPKGVSEQVSSFVPQTTKKVTKMRAKPEKLSHKMGFCSKSFHAQYRQSTRGAPTGSSPGLSHLSPRCDHYTSCPYVEIGQSQGLHVGAGALLDLGTANPRLWTTSH